jgi:hypothetical protein
VAVTRLFLHIFIIIAACTPLLLLVADIARRYPLDGALMEISLADAILLLSALALPIMVLSRLGVDWRSGPEEY